MIRIRKFLTVFVALAFLLLSALSILFNNAFAKADVNEEENEVIIENDYSEEVTPYGLFTSLTLTIDGGDGSVWSTAKNSFTLFPASVAVVVEIYSSNTYQDSYKNMTLENRQYINDLDMGKSITASASTNGTQRYWKGRMYYKVDSKDWQEKVTSTWLCDANGIVVK